MFKTFLMMLAGFIIGFILSENAQVIRHTMPTERQASGHINQFIFIFGFGNSSNTFEINAGDETLTTEEEDDE